MSEWSLGSEQGDPRQNRLKGPWLDSHLMGRSSAVARIGEFSVLWEGRAWPRHARSRSSFRGRRDRALRIIVTPVTQTLHMTETQRSQLVCGEPSDAVARALLRFKWRKSRDGMVHLEGEMDADTAAPLTAALMRAEAELLREDADLISTTAQPDPRTPAQRRADALMLVVRQLAELQRGPSDMDCDAGGLRQGPW